MTDHKFTDEEIVKALEICSAEENHCGQCPSADNGHATCIQIMCENALALINRQKANIESLKIANEKLSWCAKQERNEAIKDFAERIKAKSYPFPCAIGVEYAVTIRAINDLAKEMTEESNESKPINQP